ncbi:MAG TPA: acetolactate synthase small subunit [bacterium]|nr:acetolactate synthase small subunit [bacterium]HQG44974.1 acetolactate synthase small subunit [bacterium]HQI49163.1 acetolactate synthase small subunit [bacterium]HQJ63976.1 acetolactate synthase small subunit [bacterium]
MRHIINLEVENSAGVMARIVGLFSARGFNIESIVAGKAEEDGTARITLVVIGDDWVIEQVNKQLNKLIDVIRVTDVTKEDFVNRELLLVKIHCPPVKRTEASLVGNIFGAKVVDISAKSLTFEVTGSESKIIAFLQTVRPFGIKEVERTGPIAMVRDFNPRSSE